MEYGFVKLSQSSRGRSRLKFREGMLVMQMRLSYMGQPFYGLYIGQQMVLLQISSLMSYLTNSDVYLIFDRYHEYSIKSTMRDGRETGITRKHHLLWTTKLPAEKVVLSSVENKKQLIRILCEELTEDRLFHLRSTGDHKLVVTGEDPCPIEVQNEERSTRYDLETHQEEADIIIVLKWVGEAQSISVISDDTDVFVLLLHHYQLAGLEVPLTMESPSKERAILDINLTQAKHKEIVTNLLPVHAISGCDTVACYLGIGKGRVIKRLKEGCDLSAIGNVLAPLQQVIHQATRFISVCYGMKDSTDMSHTRLLVWGKKNGKGHSSSPNLASLPPTREAVIENVKRAHFQTVLWRTINIDPRQLKPEEFGWKMDTDNKSLSPIGLPDDTKPAPDYILEMIRCGCKGEPPPPVTPRDAVVRIKAYLAQCFVHVSRWDALDHSSR